MIANGCDSVPINRAGGACSGKCSGGGECSDLAPRVWVLAASEGMLTLLEKQPDGTLRVISQEGHAVAPSIEGFRAYIENAAKGGRFSQLLLVGGPGDIAWMRLALPESTFRNITAEIHYPLMSAWFRQTPELAQLTKALEQVFVA